MKNFFVKVISVIMACLMLCSFFTACSKDFSKDSDETRRIVDMAGNTVNLPEKVNKVFVDWASGVTLITTLSATDKLVCAPKAFETDTFAWTRIICPAIDSVKKDDDAYTNLEAVLNYEPDLVITKSTDNIETYKKLGMAAIYVDFNNNESFKESLKIVGKALGESEYKVAEKYCEYFDANYKIVTDRLSKIDPKSKQTVYYVDSRFVDPYHSVGRGEIQEEWITAAGGILATAAEFEGRNLEINAEKILEINPDIIMIGAQNQAEVYDLLINNPVLCGLDAVKNKKVYRIPQGLFPWCRTGPEAAIQMIWAAKLLYPTEFEDIDIKTVAKKFYKDFYNSDVSNETLDGILSGRICPTGK
jgi:iron complex transport system substrate-binding protein